MRSAEMLFEKAHVVQVSQTQGMKKISSLVSRLVAITGYLHQLALYQTVSVPCFSPVSIVRKFAKNFKHFVRGAVCADIVIMRLLPSKLSGR